jgi:hypothetical protein
LFNLVRSAYEAQRLAYPTLINVLWTMPVDNYNPNTERQVFNDLIRAYALDQKAWMIDMADIECRSPTGVQLLDTGRELLQYSYSSDGGHINDAGRLRMARAFWKLLIEAAKILP